MKRNQIILLTFAICAIVLLIGSRIFEFKKVPDYRWTQDYNLKSKEPFGAWMFAEMIDHHFDSSKVVFHYQDTLVEKLVGPDHLYLIIGQDISRTKKQRDSLRAFVEKGNDAFIIGSYIQNIDLLVVERGSEIEEEFSNDQDEDDFGDFDDNLNNDLLDFNLDDTIVNVVFREGLDSTIYSYAHYVDDFETRDVIYCNALNLEDQNEYEIIGGIGECENPIFVRIPFGKGNFYFHTIPEMFSNHGAKQDYFLDHFNSCFNRFDPELIVVDHVRFSALNNFDDIESPIQYILSNRSLSAAYFLLLASCLLFVVIQSKRKQRAIPITEKNYNSSLEYVQTLSNLFASHDRPSLLLPHLKKYFYHSVKTKYFIDEKNPEFVQLLSKKSRVSEDEISIIIKMLNKVENKYSFPKDQLFNLHKRVEIFYKNAI